MKRHLPILFFTILFHNILSAQSVPDRPVSASADTSPVIQHSLSSIRSSRPTAVNSVLYITDPGKQGTFAYDPNDRTTADDSVMTIIAPGGRRFKRIADQGILNVRWFGATGNGSTDDWYAIQKGIRFILNDGSVARTLYFPPGAYKISQPLIIARNNGSSYSPASINLQGPANAKDLGLGSASILPTYNNTFAIGVQMGKGVLIKDLFIMGKFTFPNKLNHIQIDTLSADEWTDGSTRQNPLTPYAGIAIDPFSDSTVYPHNSDMYPGLHGYCLPGMNRGGSTAVQITGCTVRNFVVGIMLSPSNQQNAELIDVIDCDCTADKVCYAMGQAQSKECHVDRLKCWGNVHTVFDNMGYGFRHGDGANVPLVDGLNIAGSVKQLCRIHAASFMGVFRNIYAEGLYRLGYIAGNATAIFEDCQINFVPPGGTPYPDFYLLGSNVTFRNCMLRMYNGKMGYRLILGNSNNYFEGGSMNEPPIIANLNGSALPTPTFKNVTMYYSNGILGSGNGAATPITAGLKAANGALMDPIYLGNNYYYYEPAGPKIVYKLSYHNNYERTALLEGSPVMHVDKSRWQAWCKLIKASDTAILRPGDYLLTTGLPYSDQYTNVRAVTYPVGTISSIGHDTLYIDRLAQGIQEGMRLQLWTDYYVYGNPPFIGDLVAGANTMTKVQGTLPAPGDRPDMPMLPAGTYVTAADPKAGTIRFSNANNTGQSFTGFTAMNGYPAVDIFSPYDPAYLQAHKKTLIGGAEFHRTWPHDIDMPSSGFYMMDGRSERYSIINSNFNGDTTLHKLSFVREGQ